MMKREMELSFAEIGLLLAVFNLCDAVSTYFALTNNKNAVELNYFMAELISRSWYYFFAVKIISSVIFFQIGFLADKILTVYKIPKWIATACKLFMFGLAFFFALISFHNILLSSIHPISSSSLVLCQS